MSSRDNALADVTGDGRADLCARGASGMRCWPSDGTTFGASLNGPALADSSGWAQVRFYSTLRLSAVAPPAEEPPPQPDAGPGTEDAGPAVPDASASDASDLGGDVQRHDAPASVADSGDVEAGDVEAGDIRASDASARSESSCACRSAPDNGADSLAAILVVTGLLLSRRQRRLR